MYAEVAMGRIILRTGKKVRPKTAVKGKRYLCAQCRKRSPKPVMAPAPWYCLNCTDQHDIARKARLAETEELGCLS